MSTRDSSSQMPVTSEAVLANDLLAEARRLQRMMLEAGKEVLDLSMINPDLPPPRYLLDKLAESVGKPLNHRYAVSRGIRKLRAAFSVKYETAFGIALDPEREVCVSLGSKDALQYILRAVVSPGDAVLLSAPTYPAHLSAVHLAGGRPIFFTATEDEAAMLREIETIVTRDRPRCIVLNYPHNPTGGTVSRGFFDAIAALARREHAVVINDFVYGEMVFSKEPAPSLLSASTGRKGLVELYSLSKAYSVPGWRVGALVGDEEIVRHVARLKAHADYGLFLPLQYAAAAGLTASDSITDGIVREYERRGRALVGGLTRAGWEVVQPQAGCCVWAKAPTALLESAAASAPSGSQSTHRSVAVVSALLQHEALLMSPGCLFGPAYDDHFRFALVVGEDRIREVTRRLGARENTVGNVTTLAQAG